MDSDNHTEYRVETNQGRFEILNSAGRPVLRYRDMESASHYASLLNEAFKVGFKLGYRKGRVR